MVFCLSTSSVKLPELLFHVTIEEETLAELQQNLVDLLRYEEPSSSTTSLLISSLYHKICFERSIERTYIDTQSIANCFYKEENGSVLRNGVGFYAM